MRGKCQFWLHLILIVSLTISTALMSPVTANPTATLSVNPPSIINATKVKGTTFTISINVAGVIDLFGFEFKLKYKTSVLNATSVTDGGFFGPVIDDDYIEWVNEINDTIGYVWYGASQALYEVDGVNGSGTLATISFTVNSLGGSCLYLCDTKLSDFEGHPIAHEVYDGHFVNTQVHDVAITSVTPSNTLVMQGQTVNVTVVARNNGNFTESFNVVAYANATAIGTPKNVANLARGGRKTLNFTWSTTGVTLGKYIISGNATTVGGETDTTDNTCNKAYDFAKKTYVYVTITVMKNPVAAFNYSPTSPVAGETVTFNASDSTPNGGTIDYYRWNFGDGNLTGSILPVTTHIYTQPGTYNVTLTVEDSEDLTHKTWKLITVYLADVSVTGVVPWFKGRVMNAVYRAWTIQVNVTVHNNGTVPINCTVTAYCFNATFTYQIGTQTVTNLDPCNSRTLTFNWNIAPLRANTTYTLKANATLIGLPDINPANNQFVYGQVKVRLWGDVDDNGAINILDLKKVKLALSLLIDEPFADLDGDCDVDILDLKKDKLILSGLISPFGP